MCPKARTARRMIAADRDSPTRARHCPASGPSRSRIGKSIWLVRFGEEPSLARTDAQENNFNRLQEHHEIEGEAMVLHVIQVVFKFFLGLHLRRTVAVAHLGPPGN